MHAHSTGMTRIHVVGLVRQTLDVFVVVGISRFLPPLQAPVGPGKLQAEYKPAETCVSRHV